MKNTITKSLDVIYLQEAWQDYYGETTWCADRITNKDSKFVNIEYIKKVFNVLIHSDSAFIYFKDIECAVKQLEELENKGDI